MSKPPAQPDDADSQRAPLPIGQKEGEGTNEVQHEPDPGADPLPGGGRRDMPRTGHVHGND